MSIQFLCPNGHAIRCPDEQAGRAAKCPKCGVKFRIPELSELEAAEERAPAGAAEEGPGHGVSAQQQIEFLCPNGHRLHGPASLQGRPGQCPECGSKFRIPSYDDVPDEAEEPTGGEQISVGRLDGGADSGVELEEAELEEADELEEDEEILDDEAQGLGAIFPRLWATKTAGAVVELHLDDGETVVPDRFSKASAGASHGLFAVKEPDGTYTMMAVAWDAVHRVLVRHLKQLPGDLR